MVLRNAYAKFFSLLLVGAVSMGHGDKKQEESSEGHDSVEQGAHEDEHGSSGQSADVASPAVIESFQQVEPLFRRACYDCHTDKTVFPWYYSVPLVKQLIDHDIKEAREHVDMSQGWPFIEHNKPMDEIEEILEVIEKEEMPPFLYRLAHRSALWNDQERASVVQWLKSIPAK
jgi:hypothetical protein